MGRRGAMILKTMMKGLAARLGLRIVRTASDDSQVTIAAADFSQFTRAYEALLNDRHPQKHLPPNEQRPALLARLIGTAVPEAYAILEALIATRDVPGDVCELGVAQGSTSAFIANEIRGERRILHLFDSFAGMPAPSAGDELQEDPAGLGSIEAYEGVWSFPKEMVESRLDSIGFPRERVRVHAGFIEQVLAEGADLPTQVSCAYLDFDFYEPMKVALDYLHTVLSRGAVVVVDDYDYFSTGAKKAVDEFVERCNRERKCYELEVADERIGRFATLRRVV